MNYLSYENKRIGLRHYERIMELIPEIDRTWRLAFRQLFKDYQLKGKGDCLYEVCNRLSWVEKRNWISFDAVSRYKRRE